MGYSLKLVLKEFWNTLKNLHKNSFKLFEIAEAVVVAISIS